MTLKQERLAGTESLKACPFCADIEDLRVSYVRCSDEHQWFHVECPDCAVTGPHAFVEGAAIIAWNTRPDRTEPASASSELETRLREGVTAIGIHDDSYTELFDIEDADEVMFEAADTLATLSNDLSRKDDEIAAAVALARKNLGTMMEQVDRCQRWNKPHFELDAAINEVRAFLTTNQDTPDAG